MASHTAPTHKREIERAKARETRPAHYKKTGAPPSWTPELLENIAKYVGDIESKERAYLALSDLSAVFGLPKQTLESWYLTGLQEDDDSPLRAFSVAIARARANGKEFLLNRVAQANDWRASMQLLSSLDPQNYSEKRIHAKVQHEHRHEAVGSLGDLAGALLLQISGGKRDDRLVIDVSPRQIEE